MFLVLIETEPSNTYQGFHLKHVKPVLSANSASGERSVEKACDD